MAALPVKTLPAGTYLYRQSHIRPTPTNTGSKEDDGVWSFFAIESKYGTDSGYGPIKSLWRLQSELRLLNISQSTTRERLSKRDDVPLVYDKYAKKHFAVTNCDYQYSGGLPNRGVHFALRSVLDQYGLDGTYIHEDEADDDCWGPSEVCVFSNRLNDKVVLQTIYGESDEQASEAMLALAGSGAGGLYGAGSPLALELGLAEIQEGFGALTDNILVDDPALDPMGGEGSKKKRKRQAAMNRRQVLPYYAQTLARHVPSKRPARMPARQHYKQLVLDYGGNEQLAIDAHIRDLDAVDALLMMRGDGYGRLAMDNLAVR